VNHSERPWRQPLTRRTALRLGAAGLLTALLSAGGGGLRAVEPPTSAVPSPSDGPEPAPTANDLLVPQPAIPAILELLRRYPLVGLADRHGLQQEHDVIDALLREPSLPALIDDILVEFGDPLEQGTADAYLLDGEDIGDEQLRQIWRSTAGPLWDAPVYERFFRTLHEVNLALPPEQRIRVVLADTPIDWSRVSSVADADYVRIMQNETDQRLAARLEEQVVAKGRRALIIAGGGHLRRGLHADIHPRSDAPGQPPNLGTILAQRHPGQYYVIDTLIVGFLKHVDASGTNLEPPVAANVADWQAPALAPLAGTWLGDQVGPDISYRALTPADERYGSQADAVLYLGLDDTLTNSLPDPSIYTGDYADFLAGLSPIMSAVYGDNEDWLGAAIAYARSDSRLFR
jgi:hypothetical protein